MMWQDDEETLWPALVRWVKRRMEERHADPEPDAAGGPEG